MEIINTFCWRTLCIFILVYYTYGNIDKCSLRVDRVYNGVLVNCTSVGISKVPRGIPQNTTTLILSFNNISKLYNDDFKNLTILQYLELNFNPLQHIESRVFEDLKTLLRLDVVGHLLNYNDKNLSKHIFKPLIYLQYLSLRSDISRFHEQFHPDTFLGSLTNLIHLDIDTSPNMVFSKDVTRLRLLKHLVISTSIFQCGITRITNQTFVAFSNLSILSVDHSGCIFNNYEAGSLIPFPKLKTFINDRSRMQGGNLLNIIQALSVYKMKNMTRISMSGTEFTHDRIEGGLMLTFKTLSQICVHSLDLSSCKIGTIDFDTLFSHKPHPFSRCIQHLNLSNNAITGKFSKFNFVLLSKFSNIISIDLSMQNIFPLGYNPVLNHDPPKPSKYPIPIPVCLPRKLSNLNISGMPWRIGPLSNLYFLNGEYLLSMNISFCGLYNFNRTITGLLNLQVLDVSGNDISIISENFFDTFPALTNLRMSGVFLDNNFINIHGKRLLKPLRKLKYLDLSQNDLISLPYDIFEPLVSVMSINLMSNKLVAVFDLSLPNLKSISVEFNSLTILDKQSRDLLDNIAMTNRYFEMKLLGNTFACSCSEHDFILWLMETKIKLDGRNYTCMNMEGQMTTTSLVYQQSKYYMRTCSSSYWLNLGIGGVSFMLLTLVTAFLVVKNKMKLKVLIQRLLGRYIFPKTREEFVYDASVIYTDVIDGNLCRQMELELETKRRVKLYIRHRDEPVDHRYKANQIADIIGDSFKIIFILTDDFLQSELAYFTMCTCLHTITLTSPNRLILLIDRQFTFPSNIGFFMEAVAEDNIIHIDLQQEFTTDFWDELTNLIENEQVGQLDSPSSMSAS